MPLIPELMSDYEHLVYDFGHYKLVVISQYSHNSLHDNVGMNFAVGNDGIAIEIRKLTRI